VITKDDDVLTFRQILLTSSIRNVWTTVRRMCILRSGLKGLVMARIKSIKQISSSKHLAVYSFCNILLSRKNAEGTTKLGKFIYFSFY